MDKAPPFQPASMADAMAQNGSMPSASISNLSEQGRDALEPTTSELHLSFTAPPPHRRPLGTRAPGQEPSPKTPPRSSEPPAWLLALDLGLVLLPCSCCKASSASDPLPKAFSRPACCGAVERSCATGTHPPAASQAPRRFTLTVLTYPLRTLFVSLCIIFNVICIYIYKNNYML